MPPLAGGIPPPKYHTPASIDRLTGMSSLTCRITFETTAKWVIGGCRTEVLCQHLGEDGNDGSEGDDGDSGTLSGGSGGDSGGEFDEWFDMTSASQTCDFGKYEGPDGGGIRALVKIAKTKHKAEVANSSGDSEVEELSPMEVAALKAAKQERETARKNKAIALEKKSPMPMPLKMDDIEDNDPQDLAGGREFASKKEYLSILHSVNEKQQRRPKVEESTHLKFRACCALEKGCKFRASAHYNSRKDTWLADGYTPHDCTTVAIGGAAKPGTDGSRNQQVPHHALEMKELVPAVRRLAGARGPIKSDVAVGALRPFLAKKPPAAYASAVLRKARDEDQKEKLENRPSRVAAATRVYAADGHFCKYSTVGKDELIEVSPRPPQIEFPKAPHIQIMATTTYPKQARRRN